MGNSLFFLKYMRISSYRNKVYCDIIQNIKEICHKNKTTYFTHSVQSHPQSLKQAQNFISQIIVQFFSMLKIINKIDNRTILCYLEKYTIFNDKQYGFL